ncbi:TolB family protein [Streptomyces sp. 3211]|uniref:TolB family protein n=1 Tax=Streptomyces sp. 3211 TaxID=1964449 RepID=UPI0013318BA5|nr:PD40 domain-containing protein [Streptomyces sp. 3211]
MGSVALIDMASAALTAGPASGINVALVSKSSVGSGSQSGNGQSLQADVSANGRFVAFQSDSSNINSGGKPGSQVYLKDLETGAVSLISAADIPAGVPAEPGSHNPSISDDGRFIAFESSAGNLQAGGSQDTNGKVDIYIYDQVARTITRVAAPNGQQPNNHSRSPAISGDGRYVSFASDAGNLSVQDVNSLRDVFRYNRETGAIDLVSKRNLGGASNGSSDKPQISSDGTRIVYHSDATNLTNSDTNSATDVFLAHLSATSSATSRVSVTSSGAQANEDSTDPTISADGETVAFSSSATNIVAGDTNAAADIFLRKLTVGGTTQRVSLSLDRSQANGSSFAPKVSADGTRVAFDSLASNLTNLVDSNQSRDVFVANISCSFSCTQLASISVGGKVPNTVSENARISADGNSVVFRSRAQLTADADKNSGGNDIYIRRF